MSVWRCLVVDADGRIDWRPVEAEDQEAALASIAAQGGTVLEVRGGAVSLAERLNQPITTAARLSVGDQSLLLTQLATLVRSGLPVDRSLDLLRDQAIKARQRSVLANMLSAVRNGEGLASAFREAKVFPAYVVGVIRAAEQGGGLAVALEALGTRLTLAAETRRQLATALTYPAVILIATVGALGIVLALVVPQFQPIFQGQEDRLPTLTRITLSLSASITDAPARSLLLLLGPPMLLFLFARSVAGRQFIEEHGANLPILSLREQYLAAQFTGILATLLSNGVKVGPALPLVRDAMGSERWRLYANDAERRIREGETVSGALGHQGLLPGTALRLIQVGERSGKLADSCAQASAIIGAAAKARIDRVVALVNPIAIMILGGLVAGLVGGVMLGIFSLGDFAG